MKGHLRQLPNIPEAQELARLQAQMQRPALNTNKDGSFELGWGTALLFFGLGSYLSVLLPKSVWASPWGGWVGYVPLTCAASAPFAIPKIIKRFITFPRTGYVANPHDLKFKQLVMLMMFGLALGFTISLPLILFSEISDAITRQDIHTDPHTIIWHFIKLVICAVVAVYLWRKLIRKPIAMPPSAYDAAVFEQSPTGRKRLRVVKTAILTLSLGAPILVGALVFGLMYLSKSALRQAEIHWSQLGMPSILVAANAMLYLMGSGVVLKTHKWKWLVLVIMLVAPVVIAPAIPYPVPQFGSISGLEPMPPVMLVLGFIWLVSGSLTLILFIRNNPVPDDSGR